MTSSTSGLPYWRGQRWRAVGALERQIAIAGAQRDVLGHIARKASREIRGEGPRLIIDAERGVIALVKLDIRAAHTAAR
jgi:hypothetical protein